MFIAETLNRLKTKNPRYFKIVQAVCAVLFVSSLITLYWLPEYYTIPPIITDIAGKIEWVSLALGVFAQTPKPDAAK